MVGVQVTRVDINTQAGLITNLMKQRFDDVVSMADFLQREGSAGLKALGFTDEEAATLASAFNDLLALKETFDASPFIKRCYGLGVQMSGMP